MSGRSLTDRQLLDALSRMPFIDSAEMAGILGEPHTTVHRTLTCWPTASWGGLTTAPHTCRRARDTT